MSDVKLVRLISGEEVVAEVDELEDGSIKLTNPVVVRMIPPETQDGEPRLVQSPLLTLSQDKEITLNSMGFVFTCTPIKQLVEHHKQMFGNIIVPEKGIITP